MRKKDKRFELRLSKQEFSALEKISVLEGKSKAALLQDFIARTAKRKKVWK